MVIKVLSLVVSPYQLKHCDISPIVAVKLVGVSCSKQDILWQIFKLILSPGSNLKDYYLWSKRKWVNQLSYTLSLFAAP